MTALAHRLEHNPSHCIGIESDDIADLARIYDPGVNLCVIRREPETDVKAFVETLLRQAGEIAMTEEIVFERFDFSKLLAEFREIPGHSTWWRDVARLVCIYCDLSGSERIGLRLRLLDKPMCPRFHVDFVSCRMVCTYGGIGTEWLPDPCVDRSKLGHRAGGLTDSESGAILDETEIRVMPPYAVGLMKGERWEGDGSLGAVHRSPTLTGAQPRRLLLTLDAL